MHNIRAGHRDIVRGPVDFVIDQAKMMNPILVGSLDLNANDTVEVRLDYSVGGMFAGTSFTTGKADCKFIGSKVDTA